MRESIYTRTEMLLGKEGVERLKNAKVIVFGVGGVGGYATEALVRAGVGSITLVDSDTVSVTNLNRQIIATLDTVGMYKVDACMQRIVSINKETKVYTLPIFYDETTKDSIDLSGYDYVLDCIDSVKSKLLLIETAKSLGVSIISSMGAGNKLDPSRFRVCDISKTSVDPLAKVIRVELRKRGINHLKVVFSDEEPIKTAGERLPGSVSFVPAAVGLIMAGEVIKEISRGEHCSSVVKRE